MRRKTPKMLAAEAILGGPLEDTLPKAYEELGLPGLASKLGVGEGTIWYWFLALGLSVEKKLVPIRRPRKQ